MLRTKLDNVNIVKQFVPKEIPNAVKSYKFKWGFGDDHKLYYYIRDDHKLYDYIISDSQISEGVWYEYYRDYYNSGFTISFSMMKEIIKEFDHLNVFI